MAVALSLSGPSVVPAFGHSFGTPAGVAAGPITQGVDKQPLIAHVDRLVKAMSFVGAPISDADRNAIAAAGQLADVQAVITLQQILDKYALVRVTIDPLRKTIVQPSSGTTNQLLKDGWTTFLVKINNQAGSNDFLDVDSPEAAMPYDFTKMEVERSVYDDQFTDVMLEHVFHTGVTWGTWGGGYPYKPPPQPEQKGIWPAHGDTSFVPIANRWAAVSLYQNSPMAKNLSGLPLEYAILQVYSRDAGVHSMTMSFNVGTPLESNGTGAVPYSPGNPGFRGETQLSFNVGKGTALTFAIKDEHGKPTAARFTIRDKLGRVYPHRAKRYVPDMFFQNQIYRYDGESIELPPGEYSIEGGRGPQYQKFQRKVTVADKAMTEKFDLKRWIDPRASGYVSLDKHVHTAGCLHYNDPAYGIEPKDMVRYATGEDLDIADIMIWGPNWYYQKAKYFTGQSDPASTPNNVVTHNVEVSQFPSSAGGHTSGHGMKDIDYPGTKKIEDWPSYTLPVLKWMQSQGALSSYTHSGFGLDVQSDQLPNYITPPMDSIGANEYIMTVAHGATDLLGVGNTNFISELNIWYHTLNAGFRTQIAGETDWPCINGENVGRGRSYAKVLNAATAAVSYQAALDAIDRGNSYVSDGRSHIMNFKVEGQEPSRKVGTEVKLSAPKTVKVTADITALLPTDPETIEVLGTTYPVESQKTNPYVPMPEPKKVRISSLPVTGVSWRNIPWWHIERARVGDTRKVTLEVVVNGLPVQKQQILADGKPVAVEFNVPVQQSSWVALRILGASHTNPSFVLVDKKPIRASRKSVEWDIAALRQAFEVKRKGWRPEDYDQAKSAYEYAFETYRKILSETTAP
jgi:hypothetical protein